MEDFYDATDQILSQVPQQQSSDADPDFSQGGDMENSQLIHRQTIVRSRSKDGDFDSEFSCSVCLQLSHLPTTLTCGHTTCRYCLAQWYFSSKKKECPLCKAAYLGHPKINTQLRNLLTKLYPDKTEEREKDMDDEAKSTIAKYDKELTQDKQSSKSEITSFCSGIIFASCLFVVTYLAWYWNSSDDKLLVMKPPLLWTPSDVESWMSEISWAGQYAQYAQKEKIDGRLLLSFDEDDLTRMLNITEITHAKAFLLLIEDLEKNGVKMPVNLWEYKALYPGRCLFLVFGLKDFPRTTILYLWIYFREEVFYPFVIATQEDEEIVSYFYSYVDSENTSNALPTRHALIGFLWYTIFMPEYLVGIFAFGMFKQHTLTPIFVLATVICRIIIEVLKFKDMIQNRRMRSLIEMCKAHLKHLTSAFIFMVLWPIIPSLICDVFFYCALYVSPIQMLMVVNTKLRQPPQRRLL